MKESVDWQELEAGIQRRRHARRPIQLPAQLTWRGQEFAGQIANISPGGALLNVVLPPGVTDVVAKINLRTGRAVRVLARVRWQQPTSVGIQFEGFLAPHDPIEPEI
jgi:PilZ domain